MDISKVFNANVYRNGTANLVGKVAELTLPKVTAVTEEHSALGMIGKLKLPTGLELLEMAMKWKGFYAEQLEAADPFRTHNFQIRASVQTFGAGAVATEQKLVIECRARFTEHDLATLIAMTGNEPATALNVDYIKVALVDEELLEVDVVNNIWKVRGRDLLADYRKNLGL